MRPKDPPAGTPERRVIVLDRPLTQYLDRLAFRDIQEVHFLCGHSAGHLLTNLREKRIPYIFLDVPVESWPAWKASPNYEGD